MGWTHMETVARRKAGGGPDWRICKAERVGDASLIEGGVPRPLKSGKHKGRPTWRDADLDKVIVTDAERRIQEAAYEAETGLCHVCEGKGETVASASVTEGTRYRTCSRCGGTGKATYPEVEG